MASGDALVPGKREWLAEEKSAQDDGESPEEYEYGRCLGRHYEPGKREHATVEGEEGELDAGVTDGPEDLNSDELLQTVLAVRLRQWNCEHPNLHEQNYWAHSMLRHDLLHMVAHSAVYDASEYY